MKDFEAKAVCQFREDEARAYGLHEALFLNRLRFWVIRNRQAGSNYRCGRTWSYTSARQIAPLIFTTEATTRRVIKRLVAAGVILTERRVVGGAEQPLSYAFVDEARFLGSAPLQQQAPGGAVIGLDQSRRKLVVKAPASAEGVLQNGGGVLQFEQTPMQSDQPLRYSDRYSNSYSPASAPSAGADGERAEAAAEVSLSRCVGADFAPAPEVEADLDAEANLGPHVVAEEKTENPANVATTAAGARCEAAAKRHAAAAAITGAAAPKKKGGGGRAAAAADGEQPARQPKTPRKPRFLPPTPLFTRYLAAMKAAGFATPQIMRPADAEHLEVILAACGGDEAQALTFVEKAVSGWRDARGRLGIQAVAPTLYMIGGPWMDRMFGEVFKPSDTAPGAAPRKENEIEKAMREAKERKAKRDAEAAANARSQGGT